MVRAISKPNKIPHSTKATTTVGLRAARSLPIAAILNADGCFFLNADGCLFVQTRHIKSASTGITKPATDCQFQPNSAAVRCTKRPVAKTISLYISGNYATNVTRQSVSRSRFSPLLRAAFWNFFEPVFFGVPQLFLDRLWKFPRLPF